MAARAQFEEMRRRALPPGADQGRPGHGAPGQEDDGQGGNGLYL
jgi:hypothetical protein